MQAVRKLLDSPHLPGQYPASWSRSGSFSPVPAMNSQTITSAFFAVPAAPANGVVAAAWWAHGHGKG